MEKKGGAPKEGLKMGGDPFQGDEGEGQEGAFGERPGHSKRKGHVGKFVADIRSRLGSKTVKTGCKVGTCTEEGDRTTFHNSLKKVKAPTGVLGLSRDPKPGHR